METNGICAYAIGASKNDCMRDIEIRGAFIGWFCSKIAQINSGACL
jgi:hypothetical protein